LAKPDVQENWDDLEIFTSKGAKIANPRITITDASSFVFNAAFIHLADIKNDTHLLLGYSAQNQSITFQFTKDEKAEGALKMVGQSSGMSVGSRSFFNFFFLKPDQIAGRYTPKKVKIPRVGEMWTIDLTKKLPDPKLPEK
jgi:hypothetical protein